MAWEPEVGEIVRIREWEDMASEFRVDEDGDISVDGAFFLKSMRGFCGRECIVTGVTYYEHIGVMLVGLRDVNDGTKPSNEYDFTPAMLEPVDRETLLPEGLELPTEGLSALLDTIQ